MPAAPSTSAHARPRKSRARVGLRAAGLVPVIVAAATLLAACGSGTGTSAKPTVTVTMPASTSASTPAATSSTARSGSRPGIVAVTTSGALVLLDPSSGSVTRTLVSDDVLGDEVSVSSDGSVVYFARGTGCKAEVESISVEGGTATSIAPGELPAISPDGSKLAFSQEPPLTPGCVPSPANLTKSFKLVIRALGSGAEKVLPLPPQMRQSGLPAPISHLSWAADSTRLAVSTSAVQDNEGWGLNIVDTSVAQYYVVPGSGVTFVPVTGSPAAQRSYIREGIFLPDGNLFVSRACCAGVPVHNTSRLMWEVAPGGALVHQVAIGYPNLDHVSLAVNSTGQWLLYLAGGDLYVSQNGHTPSKLTSGLIAAAWE